MLKAVELNGFKSFGKKSELVFGAPIASIVGPNGSGKSNVAEGLRFVLGEQSMKSMRSKRGEDLIWGGSATVPRGNRASVKVTFDNRPYGGKRKLDLDFDEVTLERVVYRDGQNEYLLNDTQVRLKDVIRLLAGANIGGSGYQIISQGEADRILNATPRERREMVEDALGLKLYQHKKAESERKLEETRENMLKVESLRRELAPHLKFLRKQVEKIEKTKELKDELAHKLAEYLARERAWVVAQEASYKDVLQALRTKHETVKAALSSHDTSSYDVGRAEKERIAALETEREEARRTREEAMRALGRAEGALEAVAKAAGPTSIPTERATNFARVVMRFADVAAGSDDVQVIREQLGYIRDEAQSFVRGVEGGSAHTEATAKAEYEIAQVAARVQAAQEAEAAVLEKLTHARGQLEAARRAHEEAEKASYERQGELREVEARLREVERDGSAVRAAKEAYEAEIREGIALIGSAVHQWESVEVPEGALSEERQVQTERRRSLERLKIKIEEYGAGNSDDVMREFSHTQERDAFLERELHDLTTSQASLLQIIEELDATMDKHFTDGLEKINEALRVFFGRLFNGGDAQFFLQRPEVSKPEDDLDGGELGGSSPAEVPIAGLEVSVQLPRKKVRGLEVLSGGERALTSIAMIFAMSQVNPPPFLILDETDAALDEANSKRYADMLSALSEKSQLVVITHNRATMAAAGELYGVTMGSDGVSKLLSVKLEEAERVAK
jgi:chromosome segregation protein